MAPANFQSFWLGGFECSTHKRRDRRRLDVLAATGHDCRAGEDYRLLAAHGMRTVRDGVRWHLVEPRRGRYDWSSLLLMVHAARDTGTQVIWDLFHNGYPNWVDPWKPAFVDGFAAFAGAVARLIAGETDAVPYYIPINEISFFAWVAGDVGAMNPFARGRGPELKAQMVRATIAAIEAIRAVDPRARFAVAEPLIKVHPRAGSTAAVAASARYTDAQFETVDWLSGHRRPDLGGAPRYLDLVGLNYYDRNQWIDRQPPLRRGDAPYTPLRELLADVSARVQRPLFIAETGTEGDDRPAWLEYVAAEVFAAQAAGVPVEGLCLYPVLSHLGWDDDRRCPNGLFEAFDPHAPRRVDVPLATRLAMLQARSSPPRAKHCMSPHSGRSFPSLGTSPRSSAQE